MHKKTVSGIIMILLFISMFSLAIGIKLAKSIWTGTVYTTTVYLDPSNYIFYASEVWEGFRFNVTIKVADVENLYAWQVCVLYDENLINVSRCFEPLWDPEYVFYGKPTVFAYSYAPWGLGNGSFACGSTLLGDQKPFSGSGKLVVIEFEILAIPPTGKTYSCILNIDNEDTLLLERYAIEIMSVKQDGYYEINGEIPLPPVINATLKITPYTLNLRSKGKWVTAYIELPEGYDVRDINASTVMLNDTISAEPRPIAVGDYDENGITDLMVKFDRASVISYILANVNKTKLFEERFMRVTLTITGKLNDGTPFKGSDIITIVMPMPRAIYKIFLFLI